MLEERTPSHSSSTWVVVTTHPHREGFAIENLKRQKYNVYCPMMIKRIKHARRAYDALRPLFPGYVFVQTTANRCRPILGTYGIRSMVCNGDVPSFLPAGFIESMKAREINGAIWKPETPFAPGQTVTIVGGQFDGLVGQIIEIRERDRILLLLDLLNRCTKVHIDARMLRT